MDDCVEGRFVCRWMRLLEIWPIVMDVVSRRCWMGVIGFTFWVVVMWMTDGGPGCSTGSGLMFGVSSW